MTERGRRERRTEQVVLHDGVRHPRVLWRSGSRVPHAPEGAREALVPLIRYIHSLLHAHTHTHSRLVNYCPSSGDPAHAGRTHGGVRLEVPLQEQGAVRARRGRIPMLPPRRMLPREVGTDAPRLQLAVSLLLRLAGACTRPLRGRRDRHDHRRSSDSNNNSQLKAHHVSSMIGQNYPYHASF